jgi:hypothetical protein
MGTAAIDLSMARRADSVRRAATWLFALAFALQSFVTQIHIHHTSDGISGPAIAKVLAKAPAQHSPPGENGTMDCPLCQAIAHAGVFFAPVTPLLPLPVAWVEFLTPAIQAKTAGDITTHDWRSRAPPQH